MYFSILLIISHENENDYTVTPESFSHKCAAQIKNCIAALQDLDWTLNSDTIYWASFYHCNQAKEGYIY